MSLRPVTILMLMLSIVGTGIECAASPIGQARVSVDWTRVTDSDVQRCGLSRLRAGTIERLVDDGHAVVDDIGTDGIAVSVASVAEGLRISVRSAHLARAQTLRIGMACDASFVLDVISRTAELVGEVARAQSAPTTEQQPPVEQRHAEPRAPWQSSIDFTTRASYTPSVLVGGGLGARLRLPRSWEVGLRAELAGNARLGVTVLEGFLGAAAAWQPETAPVGPYLELGPVLHAASSERRSPREIDAALGLGFQLSVSHFVGHVLVYGRLRRFEHRVGDQIAFDTGYLGLVVRVGGQLFGS